MSSQSLPWTARSRTGHHPLTGKHRRGGWAVNDGCAGFIRWLIIMGMLVVIQWPVIMDVLVVIRWLVILGVLVLAGHHRCIRQDS
jgi:hypothetical protein